MYLTVEEMEERFLDQIDAYVLYWKTLSDVDIGVRLRGLAFSMLAILDGKSNLPGFKVVPCPHPDDRAYHEDLGEKPWPDGCDISGGLHDAWCKRRAT